MAERKVVPVVIFFTPLFLGLLGLYNVTRGPQFESYRTVDVIRLLASVACFGAGMGGLMLALLRRRA
jgi:hypothetical protein